MAPWTTELATLGHKGEVRPVPEPAAPRCERARACAHKRRIVKIPVAQAGLADLGVRLFRVLEERAKRLDARVVRAAAAAATAKATAPKALKTCFHEQRRRADATTTQPPTRTCAAYISVRVVRVCAYCVSG